MLERVLNLANAVVLNKEAKDLREDVLEYNALLEKRPLEAEQVLNEIIKEKRRLNPKHKWDEEEVIIANLEKKKKK